MSDVVTRPDSVVIAGFRFDIEWLTKAEWKDEDGLAGMSHWESRVIRICLESDYGPIHEISLKETLLHEIQHMIWASVGLSEFPSPPKKKDLEEHVILRTTPGLLALLQHNPDVVEFLCAVD